MTRIPAGLCFVLDFLSQREQEDLLDNLEALTFEHDIFRGQRLKRSYAQFGYSYVSSGRRLIATEALPPFLRAIADRAQPLCPQPTNFNQCIVTRYPAGAGIGWHTDA